MFVFIYCFTLDPLNITQKHIEFQRLVYCPNDWIRCGKTDKQKCFIETYSIYE